MGIYFSDLIAFLYKSVVSDVGDVTLTNAWYPTLSSQFFSKSPFLIFIQYYTVAIESCRSKQNTEMRKLKLVDTVGRLILSAYSLKKSVSLLGKFKSKMIKKYILYVTIQ